MSVNERRAEHHHFEELEEGALFRLSRYNETYQMRDLDTPGIRQYEKVSRERAKRLHSNVKSQRISPRARVWA